MNGLKAKKIMPISRQSGFTLIEVIVFLVMLGIYGVFLVNFISSSTKHSVHSAQWTKDEHTLHQEMENIISEYRKKVTENNKAEENTSYDDLNDILNYAIDLVSSNSKISTTAPTGYYIFNESGGVLSPTSASSGDPGAVLIITLLSDSGQRLTSVFTASPTTEED